MNEAQLRELLLDKLQPLSEYEKGWVSALIDSEGHFAFCHNAKYSWQKIVIANTNLPLLVKAQSLLGGHIQFNGTHASPNICWRLEVTRKYWKYWLAGIPLIVKENARQRFLLERF